MNSTKTDSHGAVAVVERSARPRAWRPSPPMLDVLRYAAEKRSLFTGCSNRAGHGARLGTIRALRKRGLLETNTITAAGQRLLGAA
jgi:hypothetical protein